MEKNYVIGADFGSDSVRALVLDAATGEKMSEGVCAYPRWSAGKYQCAEKRMFRQHPLDYIEAFTQSVRCALDEAGDAVRTCVRAVSIDATGSTPCPVDSEGMPLALHAEFAEEPDAMFQLWKDHTAIEEAKEIDRAFAAAPEEDYTRFQGTYCSEWYWAKILHTVRTNPRIRAAAYSWTEHSDWFPAMLAGHTKPDTMYRCACAAGHKALWHSAWGGLPSAECLGGLDEALAKVRATYGSGPKGCGARVGTLTPAFAKALGLSTDVIVGGSSFDAHAGAVGAGVCPGTMVLNVGTSAVDMLVEKAEVLRGKDIVAACGQAENSILPGYVGVETSQASFGDVYAWLKRVLLWPLEAGLGAPEGETEQQRAQRVRQAEKDILPALERAAAQLPLENAVTALDWFNGRRYPSTNELAQSAFWGLGLGTTAPMLYQALVLATAFGQRRILDCLTGAGVEVKHIIAVGGIAQKSPYVMQTLCDVLRCETTVSKSVQACARGAAIYAAVSAGLYKDVEAAQQTLCEGTATRYAPRAGQQAVYDRLYARYCALGDFAEAQSKAL